jgi:predicted DNA-binding antitoxin AbrB/MazE fold protein
MTSTVHAIYENGVFRPIEKVDLPDLCEVEVEIRQVKEGPKPKTRKAGNCKGMLTIVADDDEHLKDFEDYME